MTEKVWSSLRSSLCLYCVSSIFNSQSLSDFLENRWINKKTTWWCLKNPEGGLTTFTAVFRIFAESSKSLSNRNVTSYKLVKSWFKRCFTFHDSKCTVTFRFKSRFRTCETSCLCWFKWEPCTNRLCSVDQRYGFEFYKQLLKFWPVFWKQWVIWSPLLLFQLKADQMHFGLIAASLI